jgi:CheY-like chemotaxis protein
MTSALDPFLLHDMATPPGPVWAKARQGGRDELASPRAVGIQRLALIVEGASPLGSALTVPLAASGWLTLVAHSPEDTSSIARDHALDLLVAEFHLGATSGASLAATLRRDRPSLPVVLMSGVHDEAVIELWPPTAFMPVILRADALVSVICDMFAASYRALTPVDQLFAT